MRLVVVIVGLAGLLWFASDRVTPAPATLGGSIAIDAARPGAPIPPKLYGIF